MAFLSLIAAVLMAPPAARPDLAGRVMSEGGKPVAGAHVFIATAGPRSGTSTLCPSCYADCAKRTISGADGAFRITSLDPDLLFRVLVVADGHRPKYAQKVDPAARPLEVALTPFDPAGLPRDRVVYGRVLGADGSPVVGATVEPQMFETEAFSGYSPDIFDPVAVTDLDGRFFLTSKSPVRRVDVKVEGRGHAPRIFPHLKPDRKSALQLIAGAEVSGRVVRDGKPVAGAVVGLVQVNRGIGGFVGHKEIATDAGGRFVFSNVAPEDAYYVYGLMSSLVGRGAVTVREIRVGPDGGTDDVGELRVEPAKTLSGRVVLSDGKPVPPGTRLLVSREGAWDSQSATLDAEGRFSMGGLPPEEVSVSVNVPGYRLSPRNRTRDVNNPFLLKGYVEEDIDGLTILLEPGED